MSDPSSDQRYVAALERFQTARRRPFRFSSQAGSAITSAWGGVLGGLTAGFGGQWWIVGIIVVGVTVSWTNWFVARRRGTLEPFVPVLWSGVLRRGERRSFRPVLLGRAVPSSAARRALAEAIVEQQRTSARAATWPLIGMGVTFLGLAFATGQSWLVWFWAAAIVLVGLGALVERRRNCRVDRMLVGD